jgi:hypothetical protein
MGTNLDGAVDERRHHATHRVLQQQNQNSTAGTSKVGQNE